MAKYVKKKLVYMTHVFETYFSSSLDRLSVGKKNIGLIRQPRGGVRKRKVANISCKMCQI